MSQSPRDDTHRQRLVLGLAVGLLLVVTVAIMLAPGPIPKPIRLVIAMVNLAAMGVLGFMAKKLSPPD